MSKLTRFALTVTLLAVGTAACESAPAVDEAREAEYDPAVVAAHMKDHFYRASQLQLAVVQGRLGSAKEAAGWLAEHPTSAAMPEEWEPWLTPFRAAALKTQEAADIAGAAMATAELAAACGACHQALGAEVGFAVEAAPVEGSDVVSHMQRHAWASGRMWEGLISPSGVVWDGGAEVLAESPLAPAELQADIEILSEVSEAEERVHELGTEALTVEDAAARAAIYGEFLGSCARCHQSIGAGPI
jgi:mono/diheme cytochrome c family protein